MDSQERADLKRLVELITGDDIRYTHEFRLRRKKETPCWFATRRGKKSFAAVLELISICSRDRIATLLRLRWITLEQLEDFARHTKLSETHRAVFGWAISVEQERLNTLEHARQQREEQAATFSSGLDITTELRQITSGEPRVFTLEPAPTGRMVTRYRRGVKVRTPA